MANKRFIVRHGLDNSGDNSVVNTIINVAEPVNNSDAATKYYVDTHTTGGTVTSVTATSPVESTGGTAPVISLGTGANGQLVIGTGTGFTKSTLTAGSGVSIVNASGSVTISATGSGGDVVGPASATDNAVVRFDGTTGKLIQNSTVTLSDTGVLTVPELSTTSITSTGNNPIVIAPDGTGDVHLNADSVRIGDNNTDATLITRGTGDLLLTTNEGSATEGVIRIYDGANGNITLTPNGTGQVQVGSDQVVTLTASQTLTNKSLSGSSNTFTNIPNSATTATSANTASAIVARDASGNFSAGTITATLSGNATNVTGTVAVGNGGTGLTTLTAGYIPYGNGTSAFGSSANLFWDSTNSYLGIGTSSPAFRLQLGNTSSISTATPETISLGGTFSSSAGANAKLRIWTDGTNLMGLGVSSGQLDYIASGAYSHVWYVNGSERMRIDSSGNLGIGTSSPNTTLEATKAITFSNADTFGQLVLKSASGSTGHQLNFGVDSANSISFIQATNRGTDYTNLSLQRYGGSVGIGTASPSAKLNVSGGNIDVSGSATPLIRIIENTSSGNPKLQLLDYANASSPSEGTELWYESSTGNSYLTSIYSGGSLILRTANTERMRIDSSGNLSLGFAGSPYNSAKMEIYRATAGDALMLASPQGTGNSNAIAWTNSRGDVVSARIYNIDDGNYGASIVFGNRTGQGTTTTERMRIDSSGNVGIGEAAPASRLTVRKDSSGGRGGEISIVNYAATALGSEAALNFGLEASTYDADNGNAQIKARITNASNAASDMIFSTWNGSAFGERMRIDSSGNLGIGTTSPQGRLNVSESSNSTVWSGIFQNSSNAASGNAVGIKLKISDFSNTAESTKWVGISSVQTAGSYNDYMGMAFYTKNGPSVTPAEVMRIDASGNLGIGTTTPNLSGATKGFSINSSNYGVIEINQNNSRAFNIYSNTGETYISTVTASPMYFRTNDTLRMTIDSSGNVGIGTSSPATKLEVVGTTGAQFISTFRTGDSTSANNAGGGFYGTSSGTAGTRSAIMWLDADGANFGGNDYFLINKHGSSGVVDIVNASNAAMTFYTNDTERMRIDSSGNVGIGVASPSKKLQVNGGDIYLSTAGSSIWFAATSDSGDRLRLHQSGGNAYIDWGGGTIYFRSGASSSTARMDISGSGVVTAAGMFCGNSGAKGFGAITTTTTTSTPTGGQSGDFVFIYT